MDKTEILRIAREYVSGHLNCTVSDLTGQGTVFAANDNQRYPFLEICTMGYSTVVSASGVLLPRLQRLLENKTRDEVFECPFVYGQSIYYIPDGRALKRAPLNPAFTFELLQGEAIQKLRGIRGFENSLAFDESGSTSTCIVLYAVQDSQIVALAGASRESDTMWELGVDVRPAYRRSGLATALISNLACTILEQGVVPFYCASVTNVASQAVAHRSGFVPCWVSTYRNTLDGSSSYDFLLKQLAL